MKIPNFNPVITPQVAERITSILQKSQSDIPPRITEKVSPVINKSKPPVIIKYNIPPKILAYMIKNNLVKPINPNDIDLANPKIGKYFNAVFKELNQMQNNQYYIG